MKRRNRRLVKRIVAGAVGGLAASLAMNQFQSIWSKAEEALSKQRNGGQKPSGDDATVKTAEAITKTIFRHDLTESEKRVAGPMVR
jgi:hypothetical protein